MKWPASQRWYYTSIEIDFKRALKNLFSSCVLFSSRAHHRGQRNEKKLGNVMGI